MTEPDDPPADAEQQLARAASSQPGSLLRLRDVQALNRSFRRLAEIQEALLDRIEELEEEKAQSSRWAAPLWSAGGIILGLGLAAVAFVWWQGKQSQPVAQVPEVVVQPPEVTVESPPDPAMAAAMEQMNENLSGILQQQAGYREQLGELTDRLLSSEQEKMKLMQEFAEASRKQDERLQEALAAADAAQQPSTTLAVPQGDAMETPSRDPWVGVFNGLLSSDGYGSIRLQQATRIPGQAALRDVLWMTWDEQGLVSSVIRAARVDFTLHAMTNTLVLEFHDGTRTVAGVRTELPAGGLRLELAGIQRGPWVEHFPELATSAPVAVHAETPTAQQEPALGGPTSTPSAATTLDANGVRRALDGLISARGSFSYYRLKALGSVDGKTLRMVQINWHDNSGRLVKTIEADAMEVHLHASGSVELLLRNGAFLDDGVRSPFSSDRFSLHLPRQDLGKWRQSGVPYIDDDRS